MCVVTPVVNCFLPWRCYGPFVLGLLGTVETACRVWATGIGLAFWTDLCAYVVCFMLSEAEQAMPPNDKFAQALEW